MGSAIFINYRRDDSPWNSIALYQELIKHFPRENVFKDFNTIDPGTDFVEQIEQALESCDVLLVLIGERWLDAKDARGNRRISKPDDFVRLEIATALKRNIRVIPVLFDNAVLPQAEELPEDLQKLVRRQTIEIDKTRFESDVARLVEVIKKVLAISTTRTVQPSVNTTPDNPADKETPKEIVSSAVPSGAGPQPPAQASAKWTKPILILLLLCAVVTAIYLSTRKNASVMDTAVNPENVKDTSILPADTVTKTDNSTAGDTNSSRDSTSSNTVTGASGYLHYPNFPATYIAVFKSAASNFITMKGDAFSNNTAAIQNYKPKVIVEDQSVEPANIFQRGSEWAFRFVLEGAKEDEAPRFVKVEKLIQTVFRNNGFKFQKTLLRYGKGDTPVDSYEYRRLPYRVVFTRSLNGNAYRDEVIIYHSVN